MKTKQIGYYAKDEWGNLYQFEWRGQNKDQFYIQISPINFRKEDERHYEIVEIFEGEG
jgi:hypothetical protein